MLSQKFMYFFFIIVRIFVWKFNWIDRWFRGDLKLGGGGGGGNNIARVYQKKLMHEYSYSYIHVLTINIHIWQVINADKTISQNENDYQVALQEVS